MARVAHMEHAADAPQRLPDVARRSAQRGEPERTDPRVQRLRWLPGRSRELVHELPRVDDVGRRERRGRRPLAPLRRGARCRLGARRLRHVRRERALGREHADARPHARRGWPLAPRGRPPRCRGGTLRPIRARCHTRPGCDADHPGLRLPDACRDPLLGRAGRGCHHDDDLCDPARHPHHGPRDSRRRQEHRRSGCRDGVDAVADAREGAPSARAPDAAPLRQSDDPVRALDGRDRGAHRRQGTRRRRHERSELVSGARTARRHRDRRDGDGPRPRDRGRRGTDQPGPPSSH